MSSDSSDEAGSLEVLTLLSSSSIDDENDQSRTLVFRVYKEVWDEFNKWKAEDCRQQLHHLQKPLPPPEVAEATRTMASAFRVGEPGDVETIYLCDSDTEDDDDEIEIEAGGATVLMCENDLLKFPKEIALPHPPYEFCTPSVQSIAIRMESAAFDEIDTVQFVPFADDPAFNTLEYLSAFKFFAWQVLADPDGRSFNLGDIIVVVTHLDSRRYVSGGDPIRGSAPAAPWTRTVPGRY
jgi:hypothetical protein